MARSFSSTQFLNLADDPDQQGMPTITWANWFSWSARGSSGGYIFGKPYRPGSDDATWAMQLFGGLGVNRLRTRLRVGVTTLIQDLQTVIPTDTWVHSVARYDGANLDTFLNGVPDGPPVPGSGSVNNAGSSQDDLFIGAMTGATGNRWIEGPICECAMWNRGLSDAEVAMVYRFGVFAVPQGLVVYIPVNGNPALEREFIKNRGTLTQTPVLPKARHAPIATIGWRSTGAVSGVAPLILPPCPNLTFDEMVLSDFNAIKTSGEHFSCIRYNPNGAGFGPEFRAFVIEGNVGNTELIGFVAEAGKEPIIVQVSLTDVPVVTKNEDVVIFKGQAYTLQAILEEDAGARRLYFVR